MIYPESFAVKTGFEKIIKLLHEYCLSPLGRSMVDAINFTTDFEYLSLELAKSKEFKAILQLEDEFPFTHFFDLREALKRVAPEGTYINTEELFNLHRSLQTIYSIVRFLFNKKESYPNLYSLSGNISVHKEIIQKCGTLIDEKGYIKDSASKELGEIRMSIARKRQTVSKIMQKILKESKNDGLLPADTELSVRDGRLVIPINTFHKRKISGVIHDESASGKTTFIEPTEAFEANNEIVKLEFDEKREIIKILTEFSNYLRPYLTDLQDAYIFLGEIDFLRAKSTLAISLNAVAPILENSPILDIKGARHPILYLSHRAQGKSIVPLDLYLNSEQRILVISGPNAGGKSVCLKTVGLLQYMLQCGLLIPVEDHSKVGIFDHIFIDIGDEQSIENDLSTYSSHLTNMKNFLIHANNRTLLLIDEFGTGTEPMLGGAIAEAVLEQLNKQGCFGVITTHYTNLKHFASSTPGIINGAMLYNSEEMHPLYKLSIGTPGSSFAFEIANTIGLPKQLLENAKQKIGVEHVDFDKNLKEIDKDKQFIARKVQEIKEKEEHLRQNLKRYEDKLKEINVKQKEILSNAHQQAEALIAQSNKEIEKTIKSIKEAQAEKEATKVARQNLEDFKVDIAKQKSEEENRINKKIQKILEKQEHRAKKKANREQEIRQQAREMVLGTPVQKPEKQVIEKTLKVEKKKDKALELHDFVCVNGQTSVGEIVELSARYATVAFGQMTSKIALDRLVPAKNVDKKNESNNKTLSNLSNKFHEKRLNFKTEIDIRGQRGDDALMTVREFVEEGIMLDIKHLQILHGKGDGILRKLIRDFLKTIDLVESVSDAPIEFGGDGITIVKIE